MAAVIDFHTARRIHRDAASGLPSVAVRGTAAPIVTVAGALAPVIPQSTLADRPPLRMIHGGRSVHMRQRRRMYLRRRLLVAATLLVVLVAFVQLASAVFDSVAGAGTPHNQAVAQYQAQVGDSLWTIAADYLPQMNRSDAVAKLLIANPDVASHGGRVDPGATVLIPAG